LRLLLVVIVQNGVLQETVHLFGIELAEVNLGDELEHSVVHRRIYIQTVAVGSDIHHVGVSPQMGADFRFAEVFHGMAFQ